MAGGTRYGGKGTVYLPPLNVPFKLRFAFCSGDTLSARAERQHMSPQRPPVFHTGKGSTYPRPARLRLREAVPHSAPLREIFLPRLPDDTRAALPIPAPLAPCAENAASALHGSLTLAPPHGQDYLDSTLKQSLFKYCEKIIYRYPFLFQSCAVLCLPKKSVMDGSVHMREQAPRPSMRRRSRVQVCLPGGRSPAAAPICRVRPRNGRPH